MTPHELRARTKNFAIAVIRFCVALPSKDPERVIGRQLQPPATKTLRTEADELTRVFVAARETVRRNRLKSIRARRRSITKQ